MERFAFKIDKALKANLSKICRLCGIDNPEKVSILSDQNADVVNVDEPDLREKIFQLVGFMIAKDDKMPQTICALCLDKINDFYEFREMCYATNAQTRKLLGLKRVEPVEKIFNLKIEVEAKRGRKRKSEEVIPKLDIKSELEDGLKKEAATSTPQRKKLRIGEPKKQNLLTAEQQRLEKILKPKEELKDEKTDAISLYLGSARFNLKHPCSICDQRCATKLKLDQHISRTHVPNISRYVCNGCSETIHKKSDIKNHQLWHKLSKTPYRCAMCPVPLASMHAFTRHLPKHWQVVPTSALLLDRECPQCRETFVTNFLYNIHPCSVRTMTCAGCNRQQRNEADYLRHAAHCPKAYLTHSRHLTTASAAAESCVRIKNENEVEAAEALARNAGLSIEMEPILSLERLPSPVFGTVNEDNAELGTGNAKTSQEPTQPTIVKSGKKGGGATRKELKRVDELLKSTLDALVSIKHEPEVHVDTDKQTLASDENSNDSDTLTALETSFQDCSDDDVHDDQVPRDMNPSEVGAADIAAFTVKQEVIDEAFKEIYNGSEWNIKKEVMHIAEVDAGDTTESTPTKVPALKIKIKKEHGTLNSSLVDDEEFKGERKKNKKKKRKEAEKERLRDFDSLEVMAPAGYIVAHTDSADEASRNNVAIKQEPLDKVNNFTQETAEPEATVMTSIPVMHFQIACISSGVPLSSEGDGGENKNSEIDDEELLDIKPNRVELDRMLQITSVSSGVDMNEHTKTPIDQRIPIGEDRFAESQEQHLNLKTVHIKAEPQSPGYSDEPTVERTDCEQSTPIDFNSNNDGTMNDEQTYIDGIDFDNIRIKQEEIEVCAVEMSIVMPPAGVVLNSLQIEAVDASSVCEPHSEEDDYDEDLEEEVEDEEREYRELEEPPLLAEYAQELCPRGLPTATTFPENSFCENGEKQATPLESSAPLSFRESCSIALNYNKATESIDEEIDGLRLRETGIDKSSNECKEHAFNPRDDRPITVVHPIIVAAKETTVTAQPFTTAVEFMSNSTLRSAESNEQGTVGDLESVDEERQNLLNNSIQCGAQPPTTSRANFEETENLINESADAALRQEQMNISDNEGRLVTNHPILLALGHVDNEDVNEIAENNNNANIERELLEESAASSAIYTDNDPVDQA